MVCYTRCPSGIGGAVGLIAALKPVLQLPDAIRLIPFSAEKGDGRDDLLSTILQAAEG